MRADACQRPVGEALQGDLPVARPVGLERREARAVPGELHAAVRLAGSRRRRFGRPRQRDDPGDGDHRDQQDGPDCAHAAQVQPVRDATVDRALQSRRDDAQDDEDREHRRALLRRAAVERVDGREAARARGRGSRAAETRDRDRRRAPVAADHQQHDHAGGESAQSAAREGQVERQPRQRHERRRRRADACRAVARRGQPQQQHHGHRHQQAQRVPVRERLVESRARSQRVVRRHEAWHEPRGERVGADDGRAGRERGLDPAEHRAAAQNRRGDERVPEVEPEPLRVADGGVLEWRPRDRDRRPDRQAAEPGQRDPRRAARHERTRHDEREHGHGQPRSDANP